MAKSLEPDFPRCVQSIDHHLGQYTAALDAGHTFRINYGTSKRIWPRPGHVSKFGETEGIGGPLLTSNRSPMTPGPLSRPRPEPRAPCGHFWAIGDCSQRRLPKIGIHAPSCLNGLPSSQNFIIKCNKSGQWFIESYPNASTSADRDACPIRAGSIVRNEPCFGAVNGPLRRT